MIQFFKNNTFKVSVIFGLLVLSLVLFLIWPLLSSISDSSQDLFSEKNDTAVLKIQSDEIENFKKVYEVYKPDLEKIGQLFIDPKNPVDFIKFLETSASDSNIKLQVSLAGGSKDQSVVGFQLFASENFTKILDFSRKLENGPYLVEIQSIAIKNAGANVATAENSPSGKVDATFLINVFAKQ